MISEDGHITSNFTSDYFSYATNAVLYAKWEANTFTLPIPTRTGFNFLGWFDSEEMTNKVENTFEPTKDIMLYAKWEIAKYNIDLNLSVDGVTYGTGYNNRIYFAMRINGQDKGYIQDLNDTFDYGTTWEIYGLKIDNVVLSYSESGTLTANLQILKYFYNVNFVSNNNGFGTVSLSNLLVLSGTTVSTSGTTLKLSDGRTVTATAIGATGYTTVLSNWSPASGAVTSVLTITANFTRTANNYTATFNSNGGTAASPATITKPYNTALGTLPTTSRAGWNFLGWFTAVSGGNLISTSTPMPLNGATYYAQWSDTTAPTVTGLTATAVSASSYNLNITASDVGSGLKGYYISTSSATPTVSSAWITTSNGSYVFSGAVPSATYYVWTIDNFNNISAVKSINTAAINYRVNNNAWFTTLQQSIDAAGSGSTIYLLVNYTDTSTGTFTKSLYFNTNGKTLTRNAQLTVNAGVTMVLRGAGTVKGSINTIIRNSGTLTLEHTGTLQNTTGVANVGLIHNSGTVNKTGSGTINSYRAGIYSTGTVNVSAGTISSSYGHAIKTDSSGKLTISGGTVKNNSADYSAVCSDATSTTTISGGSISNPAGAAVTTYSGTLKVSGGTINGKTSGINSVGEPSALLKNLKGKIYVTGGTIIGGDNAILNGGQLDVTGGTIYSTGSSAGIRNGHETAKVGLAWIGGTANVYSSGSGAGVSNSSNSKWPTANNASYIRTCTKGCSMHITGSAKISAKGSSGYGARTMSGTSGNIHCPQSFTGYIYSKASYVLHNAGTGKIVINGGSLYAQKGSSYFTGGNKSKITIKSTVKKYTKAP